MKFSIVTAVRNGAAEIGRTAESVLAQTGAEVEYIVIDGNSTDGTVAALAPYRDRLAALVSEPDTGIYNAMNKGIRRATGDVIGLLNAGDAYAPGALAKVAGALAERAPERTILWGDVVYSKIGRVRGFRPENRWRGAFAPHPSMFCPRAVYDFVGLYDESFRLLGDYDFMYRAINVMGVEPLYLPEVLAYYEEGGLSDRHIATCLADELRVKLKYGRNPIVARTEYCLKLLKNLPRMLR